MENDRNDYSYVLGRMDSKLDSLLECFRNLACTVEKLELRMDVVEQKIVEDRSIRKGMIIVVSAVGAIFGWLVSFFSGTTH